MYSEWSKCTETEMTSGWGMLEEMSYLPGWLRCLQLFAFGYLLVEQR